MSILLGCRSMMILSTSISVSPRTMAQGELLKGNPEPVKWYSHRQDVTLGNPFGPFVVSDPRPRSAEGLCPRAGSVRQLLGDHHVVGRDVAVGR